MFYHLWEKGILFGFEVPPEFFVVESLDMLRLFFPIMGPAVRQESVVPLAQP